MADYGVRVSQPGVDTLTGSDTNMIMTSKYATVKIIGVATIVMNFQAGNTDADATVFYLGGPGRGGGPGSGFGAGDIIAPVASGFAVYPFLFANTTTAQYFRGNVGFSSGSDQISAYCFASYFAVGPGSWNPGATIGAIRLTSSSTWPGAYTFNVKLYIMEP